MNILILGVTGMIGSNLFRSLSQRKNCTLIGTYRGQILGEQLWECGKNTLVRLDDPEGAELVKIIKDHRVDVVINAIGIIKSQLGFLGIEDKIHAIQTNALLPLKLQTIAKKQNVRLIQISTDCVFSGLDGFPYTEKHQPNATDFYGVTKRMGEVTGENTLTIRTSLIGEELFGRQRNLLAWFLNVPKECSGFYKAYFNGLTVVEFAKILYDYVIFNTKLEGTYHIGANRISKFSLLKLISKVYELNIEIHRIDEPVVDRTLDFSHFQKSTGYSPTRWVTMIKEMHNCRLDHSA